MSTAPLRRAHAHLYKKVPFQAASFSLRTQLAKLALYLAIISVAVVVLPFLPTRFYRYSAPSSPEQYLAYVPAALLVGLLLAVGAVYSTILTPWRQSHHAHRLVGRFPVRMKTAVLGQYWLEFAPDDTHRVSVSQSLFARVEPGDQVEVSYSADGELQKVVLVARSVSGR
ncbi:hypothetical protein [Hymenobacter sp. UYP22]|uniref:hypothetical protein n=1 Tax=Hymenobacter sp. UYP22 TaxID=3156348 RepID=UPI0033966A5F